MLENTTVTLQLHDFDRLRAGQQAHSETARRLSGCFVYSCTKNPYPKSVKNARTQARIIHFHATTRGRFTKIA
jgi:hypothetical protein